MTVIESPPARSASLTAPSDVIGGVGGLVFVAAVIAQNVIRSIGMPRNDASPERVMEYYAGHRSATFALAALFAVSGFGLATFAGSLVARLSAGSGELSTVRSPAFAGAFGVASVFALFPITAALDFALSGYVHVGNASPDTVSALWVLHNAVFGLLSVALGIALAGLTAAAAASGLVRPPWKQVGGVGGLLLAVSGAATPAVIDGNPIQFVGLIGFLAWLAFVATSAIVLLRQPEPAD